ncbi:uncharacterized protein C7orf57 isoform X1 [Callorhinchus milii]|uniref:uncharacterized protein C7orf57 isoform X1 n=1 Tax=Callorhinchus milii TaxID=7868 RepID=UPI00045739D1|nr:uncharacterized protein C7orf57 isoform X1 [Callorhinchus milii]|eukprot:gi/632945136/ref/XP_007887887.1/ PREDICTED: uncharacterized protein C7orf57-like isoform X2 [Callorhinchus milii]
MSTHGQYSECDWFYHAPRKPVNKPERVEVQLPPTSQIPGLSDLAEPHKEITFDNRRKWIRDTDSDFIKLSKQGGRPDLLRHHTPPPKKTSPILYLQPDWYVHGPPSPRSTEVPKWYLPEYMVHHEFTPKHSDVKRAAQHTEKKQLQREAEDNEKENKRKVKLKLPAIGNKTQKEKMFGSTTKKIESSKTARGDHLANKCTFPPMPLPRIEEPVNITKLLNNEYANEWIQQQKEGKKGLQDVNSKEEPGDSETCQLE